jgi:hypothetical protein
MSPDNKIISNIDIIHNNIDYVNIFVTYVNIKGYLLWSLTFVIFTLPIYKILIIYYEFINIW